MCDERALPSSMQGDVDLGRIKLSNARLGKALRLNLLSVLAAIARRASVRFTRSKAMLTDDEDGEVLLEAIQDTMNL